MSTFPESILRVFIDYVLKIIINIHSNIIKWFLIVIFHPLFSTLCFLTDSSRPNCLENHRVQIFFQLISIVFRLRSPLNSVEHCFLGQMPAAVDSSLMISTTKASDDFALKWIISSLCVFKGNRDHLKRRCTVYSISDVHQFGEVKRICLIEWHSWQRIKIRERTDSLIALCIFFHTWIFCLQLELVPWRSVFYLKQTNLLQFYSKQRPRKFFFLIVRL